MSGWSPYDDDVLTNLLDFLGDEDEEFFSRKFQPPRETCEACLRELTARKCHKKKCDLFKKGKELSEYKKKVAYQKAIGESELFDDDEV